ncbi:MAG: 4a-hydroxytetrahydrobiopterin dehydratase [Gammaproteobacteria bacterium]|jgi:4a-hydroxytetrahydrobiopterin dehydratase|tara:strand:+ start:698 stop:1087 length:390 start_codon:yes stop_codon:yes gene_type:complete
MSSSTKRIDALWTVVEIRKRLMLDLPQWELRDNGLWREYKTSGWKSTLMVVGVIGHFAEIAWHHPDLSVSYAKVGVRITNHDAGGVTGKDFALAIKIDDALDWNPATESDSPLQGIPAGSNFDYWDSEN